MSKGAFKNLVIKSLNFKNKLIMAPISSNQADENGFPKEYHYIHYGSRVIGSVGAIIVEGTAIDKNGRVNNKELGIWSDSHIKGLKKIADGIKSKSVVAGIQLFYGINHKKDEEQDVNKMTIKTVKRLVKSFKLATKRAVKAGYDIIEINAEKGYLIESFLSANKNKRNDNYGGDLRSRANFLVEVVRAIKSELPEEKVLAIRLSSQWLEENSENDQMAELIEILKEEGVDLLDVNKGEEINRAIDTEKNPLEIIEKLPVLEGGLINIVKEPEEIIKKHKSTGVGFLGKATLRDSYWQLSF